MTAGSSRIASGASTRTRRSIKGSRVASALLAPQPHHHVDPGNLVALGRRGKLVEQHLGARNVDERVFSLDEEMVVLRGVGVRGPDGRPNPTYRCLFPEPPPAGTIPACAEAGILGALTGVIGSLMALEVIREIVGFGEGLVGRLLMIDARSLRFETLSYAWDENNPLSGKRPSIRGLTTDDERRTREAG